MRWLVTLVLLVACAAPVTGGTVVERRFEPTHEESYSAQEIGCGFGFDADGDYTYGCGRLVTVTKWRTVPDRWYLRIENCGATQDDCRDRTVEVSQAVHDSTTIGEWYEVPQ